MQPSDPRLAGSRWLYGAQRVAGQFLNQQGAAAAGTAGRKQVMDHRVERESVPAEKRTRDNSAAKATDSIESRNRGSWSILDGGRKGAEPPKSWFRELYNQKANIPEAAHPFVGSQRKLSDNSIIGRRWRAAREERDAGHDARTIDVDGKGSPDEKSIGHSKHLYAPKARQSLRASVRTS